MKVTIPDVKLIPLRDALVSGFNEAELDDLVRRIGDGRRLERITSANGLDAKALDVVTWANQCGQLRDLFYEAAQLRPGHPVIEASYNELDGMIVQLPVIELPSLLPYLADRNDQEHKLDEVLDQLRDQPAYLVVCLIHGDELEAHEEFFDRLRSDTLPRLLSPDRLSMKAYPLTWPKSAHSRRDLHKRIRKNLAKAVLVPENSSEKDINDRLAAHPSPVLIHTYLLTEDWCQYGCESITWFLEFWQKWPILAPTQRLFVCISIKYQIPQKTTTLDFRKYFTNRRWTSMNKTMTRYVENVPLHISDRLTFAVLPRLEGIKESDAHDWARSDDVSRLCRRDRVINDIRIVYREWESANFTRTIPMYELARRLEEIVRRNRT